MKIVNMTTNERRELIEEISNISGYEEKREKGLRKLEKVETNLKEADILMSEKTKYLKELKSEKEQAEKYHKIKEDLRFSNLLLVKAKIIRNNNLKKKKEEDLEKYDSQLEEHKTKLEEFENKIKNIEEEITKLEKSIEIKSHEDFISVTNKITSLEHEIQTLEEKKAEYKKQLFDDGDWIESEHITNKGVRLIQTGNIGVGKYLEQKSKKYIYPDSFIKLNCKLLQKGDLLICRLAEPAGRACILPNINEKNVITSVDVTIFRPNINIVNRIFLNYVFSTHEWFNKVYESVGGTTHKRISRGSLGKIEILLPPIQEQNRIATILSDMDNEINALEKKLSKTKELKQGLMQQLLTGKIRLV